jgi:hypothetical protein
VAPAARIRTPRVGIVRMHGFTGGGHAQQWSADVLMDALAAARGETAAPEQSTSTDEIPKSRKRPLHASGQKACESEQEKRHAGPSAVGAAVDSGRNESPASVDKPFELNVGGRVFATRRATLTMETGSMLANLFDESSAFDEVDRDPSGRVFLDRDGDSFAVVLDYLRRAGRLVGRHSEDMLSRVREDAEYFGLAGLVTAIDAYEERQQARQAELRRQKVVAYRHMLYGPMKVVTASAHENPPYDTEVRRLESLSTAEAQLQRFCDLGWRVEKMSADAEGIWLDLLLGRETNQLVDDD